ncbi:sulfurtransferase [Alkalilimnicola sp. S0819]|nr:rhodanese-like domain-containing protein [Alkalilimnicola sp. S0819]KAB7627396.1 sulfurtransferase [Alkalilimnicola sp. S0819]MPQ16056.1 sulfurtransferase [Alkalilimnicola sp. S0819]
MRELEPSALKRMIDEGEAPLLLDVREGWELEQARLPGVTHIPMAQIPGRVDELRTGAPLVVICHHGGRSLTVAEFLVDHAGFTDVHNLTGGMDAWSREVDPRVPRY